MSEPPVPPRPGARELALGLALPALVLAVPAALSGLGDPFELNVADVGRRAGLHLFGAPGLALAGAENRLPTLGDVGRGELPVLAVALAQRLAGLGPWAARAPGVLAGAAGLGALWLWARRAAGPRAASHAAWVLATLPLYAAQSRTLTGDVMAMAALVASFAGLSVLLFDERVEGARALGWGALALAGLGAGFGCRGAVLGLAVPLAGVGAAALLTRPLAPRAAGPRWRGALAALALAGGAAAFGAGAFALARAEPGRVSYGLGAAAFEGLRYPTFDQTLQLLGHGLFPWSAFVPGAFALLSAPPASLRAAADARAARHRVALALAAGASYAAHAWLAPTTGPLPFTGVGLVAAALALALDELGRRRGPLRTMAIATTAFTLLLALDLRRLPETTLAAHVLPGAALPEGFAARAAPLWTLCALLFAAPLALALWPAWSPRSARPGRCARSAGVARPARLARAVRRDRLALAGGVAAGLVPGLLIYPDLSARWSPDAALASYRRLRRAGEPLGLWGVATRSPAYYGEPAAAPFADAPAALAWLAAAPAPARRWLLVRAADLPEFNSLWRARAPDAADRNVPVLDARSGHIYLAASSLREGERNATPLAPLVGDERPRPARPLAAVLGDELEALGWSLFDADGRPAEALARGRTYELHIYYRVVATPSEPWRAFVHLEGGAQRHTAEHAFEAYPMSLWQPGDIITDRTTLRLEPNFAPGIHSLYFGLFRGEARAPVGRGGVDDRVEAGPLRVR